MIWALHGALGHADDWALLPEAIAVDLWDDAHGQESLTEWARAFNQQVRERDPSPTLVGYSMGGRLALHALLESTGLWKGAVIVSAHLGLPDPLDRRLRRERDQGWDVLLQNCAWDAFLAQWDKQPVFDGHRSSTDRRFHPAMHRCFNQWSLGNQKDLSPLLSAIPCPVLWIAGADDTKFVEHGRRAIASLADARLELIPGCGHRVPWQMKQFSQVALNFLSKR